MPKALLLILALETAVLVPAAGAAVSAPAIRFAENPIVVPASSATLGNNINGPSLIRVPDWVDHPLGRYYLYFAHHGGKFRRRRRRHW